MDVRRLDVTTKTVLRLVCEVALAAGFLWVIAHSVKVSADVSADAPGAKAADGGIALGPEELDDADGDLVLAQGLSEEGREELRRLIANSDPKRVDRRPGILGPPVIAPPGGAIGAPYGKRELSQGEPPANGHYLDYSDELPEQPPEPGTGR